MDAIVTQGLTKRFGARTAVDRLDLTVRAGCVFGFLGPNGAGKTTGRRAATVPGQRGGDTKPLTHALRAGRPRAR